MCFTGLRRRIALALLPAVETTHDVPPILEDESPRRKGEPCDNPENCPNQPGARIDAPRMGKPDAWVCSIRGCHRNFDGG